MKKNVFFLLMLVTFITLTLASCSGNSADEPSIPPTPEKPESETSVANSDTISVSFLLGGEINISQEPLGRAASNDLYGLNVFQSIHPATEFNMNLSKYAYGYFDNLNSVTLKLAKDRYYFFELVYIPDGKSKVYQYSDGHYANPFESIFADNPINGKLNEIMYSTKCNLSMLDCGATQAKGITDYKVQSNGFNTIERYQGTLWNFHATDDNKNVSINLYRMMVGIKLIVDDFTEGQVCVSGTHSKKHILKPTQNSTTNILDIVVELPQMPSIEFVTLLGEYVNDSGTFQEIISKEQPFLDEQESGMYVTYTDKDGNEISLYSNVYFNYKRLTKHVLQFSVSEAIANGGITPEIKDDPKGPLKEGEWSW